MFTKIGNAALILYSVFLIIFVTLSLLTWKNTYSTKLIIQSIPVSKHKQLGALKGQSILLISDLHIGTGQQSLNRWHKLLDRIIAAEADFLFFAGDFIGDIDDTAEISRLRSKFIESLRQINKPFALVLGNHETWTGRQTWLDSFRSAGLPVLENETIILHGESPICVIGIADSYSGYSRETELDPSCLQLPRVYLTHDPAAAFEFPIDGVWLAGHTHCGQIRFPFIGAPWVPSSAPEEVHCGLYRDNSKIVFTSSGVGTSLLPVRFLAQSQVELLVFN